MERSHGGALSSEIFFAVTVSAVLHASWNIVAKKVSGNIGVLWVGQMLAAMVLFPAALYFGHVLPESWTEIRYLVLTG